MRFLVVLFWLLWPFYAVFGQNTSNRGRDFWLGYGNHVEGFGNNAQRMSLYITSDVNTSGKVEVPGLNYSASFTVVANSITVVDIPQQAYLKDEGLYNLGIHVSSQYPVVVYSHIYNNAVSGATLVLPVNTLGKEYYSINYNQKSNSDESYSYFFVVATEDRTEVEIIPAADTKGGWQAGKTYRITLNKGEVYQVLGKSLGIEHLGVNNQGNPIYNYLGVDLTGSIIKSVSTTNEPCKRIAVFSGSGKIAIGCNLTRNGGRSSDNLYQQVYPTASWGKKFISVPFKDRNYDIIRVVKADPATTVKVNGVAIPNASFVNNFYYEFSTQSTNVIESDKPIQAVQYAVTQNQDIDCRDNAEVYGDPEMIFLNPLEQNIEKITVYSSAFYAIDNHFINVVIETEAVNNFRLDGQNMGTSFAPVPNQPGHSFAQFRVAEGVHTLSADKGFNAIAYGFGRFESYGYSAGTNVKTLSLEAQSKNTNEVKTAGCTGEPFDFKLYILYPTNKLSWDIGNGQPVIEQSNPQYINTVQKDDKLYYVYQYPGQPVKFDQPGNYSIEITVNKPGADGCGSTEVIYSDFAVYDPPVVNFEATATCQEFETTFQDWSNTGGALVKRWFWDFGDGHTSEEQNPKHTYASPGTFNVTLTVETLSGCNPVTSAPKSVVVYRKPSPNVSITGSCVNSPVVFTNTSAGGEEENLKWIWDYGDGKKDTLVSVAETSHTYTSSGVKNVSLKVVSTNGCEELKSFALTIYERPVADFELPKACVDDKVVFNNTSTFSGGVSQLRYEWSFNYSPSDNSINSVMRHGEYSYASAGDYVVRLKVFTPDGCESVVQKTFRVNGRNPRSAFDVLNRNSLCGNNEIEFVNRSSVDFGTVTKLEWMFDYENNSGVSFINENPGIDQVQKHTYPISHSRVPTKYKVLLKAYSGNSCFDITEQEVYIKGVPEATIQPISPVCQESRPFRLSGGEVHGFIKADEMFSGPGLSRSGVFDPRVAGPGTHRIKYVFVADNFCTDTTETLIKVNPSPIVDAGKDLVLLEGESITLKPNVGTDVIKYSWVPAIGLNRTDILNPVAAPVENIEYRIRVTSNEGCIAEDTIYVKVLKILKIPNVFTPNGDGVNDKWRIPYLDTYPGCSVAVFNRQGAKVFQSSGYEQPWEGKTNGEDLPAGVYYYLIEPKNGRKVMSGNVTIMR